MADDDRRTWTKADWQRAVNIAEREIADLKQGLGEAVDAYAKWRETFIADHDQLKAESGRLREAYELLRGLWVERGHGGSVPLRPERSPYPREAAAIAKWLKLDAALGTQDQIHKGG